MSADNRGHVSTPFGNILNSIQDIRDRLRVGESNESDGDFNLSNFWDTLSQAVQAVSQESTKLTVAYSKPPLPSQKDEEKLADAILKSVLTLSTVFYWLPKSQGVSLRRQVRDATVEVVEGVAQLVGVIVSSPQQCLTQAQLTSVGGVWSACDQFQQLPRDNKAALLVILSLQIGVVKDAIEEIEQALAEAHDPFSDVLTDEQDGEEPRGNQDTYWSEKDRRIIGSCQGLMKASAACLRKLSAAVSANGDITTAQNVAQLDDLGDISKKISPGVDDLALCLYPPMEYSGVQSNVCQLAALLKKVLGIIRSSHVCGESQLTWVQFLDGAIDHNLQKVEEFIQQDS